MDFVYGKLVLKDEPLTHNGLLSQCGKWVELTTVLATDEQARTYTCTPGTLIALCKTLAF